MSFSPVVKSAFRIGAVVLAVCMLGGYLWMMALPAPKSSPRDPGVSSKNAVILDQAADAQASFSPALPLPTDPAITSKSFNVVRFPKEETPTLSIDPSVTSKSRLIFHPPNVGPAPSPTPAQLNAPPKR